MIRQVPNKLGSPPQKVKRREPWVCGRDMLVTREDRCPKCGVPAPNRAERRRQKRSE